MTYFSNNKEKLLKYSSLKVQKKKVFFHYYNDLLL